MGLYRGNTGAITLSSPITPRPCSTLFTISGRLRHSAMAWRTRLSVKGALSVRMKMPLWALVRAVSTFTLELPRSAGRAVAGILDVAGPLLRHVLHHLEGAGPDRVPGKVPGPVGRQDDRLVGVQVVGKVGHRARQVEGHRKLVDFPHALH